MCKRPHCTSCSNRERILVDMTKKPVRKRVCHTCAISMDNILVQSIRNSQENSFEAGEDIPPDIIQAGNPMLARSFEATIRDSIIPGLGGDQSNMSMMVS